MFSLKREDKSIGVRPGQTLRPGIPSDVPRHLLLGGGTYWPTDQLLLLRKKKVTENTIANSLAAWLPFDQLSCKFDNIRGVRRPHTPNRHVPGYIPKREALGVSCIVFNYPPSEKLSPESKLKCTFNTNPENKCLFDKAIYSFSKRLHHNRKHHIEVGRLYIFIWNKALPAKWLLLLNALWESYVSDIVLFEYIGSLVVTCCSYANILFKPPRGIPF